MPTFGTWCFIINKAFLSTMLTCADNTLWNTTHFMKRYVCMFAFIIRVVAKYCITHPISYHFIHILIRHVKTVTSAVHKKMIHMRQWTVLLILFMFKFRHVKHWASELSITRLNKLKIKTWFNLLLLSIWWFI